MPRFPNEPVTDRRTFLAVVAGGLLAAPLAVEAQQRGKTWRVGFLAGGGRPPDGAPPLPLRQALQELGYVEQQNVVYLGRGPDAKQDRLPGLAAELVGLKVDVIVTVGGPASAAAKQATSSIPIVLAQVGDADGIGLIESLAHPGGNVTGVTDHSTELSAKRLEFLKEAVPKAARIAVLWNADDRGRRCATGKWRRPPSRCTSRCSHLASASRMTSMRHFRP
jgi:putative ABC transport system substrate-binding protein